MNKPCRTAGCCLGLLAVLLLAPVYGQDHSVDLLGETAGKVGPGGPARLPPPAADTVSEMLREVQGYYPDIFGRVRNKEQARWRAFALAKANADIPAARWVLLERAIELAIDERNPIELIDILAYRHRSFAIEGSLAAEQGRRLASMHKSDLRDALLALTTDPTDPAAHDRIGRELCFKQRAWLRGLPHLARGEDGPLRELAIRELALAESDPASEPAISEGLALGNAWYDQGKEVRDRDLRPAFFWRAGHHFRQLRFRVDGIARQRIEQRLEDRELLRSMQVVDLFPYLTLEGDKFKGRWSGAGGVLRVEKNEKGDHLTLPLKPHGDYVLEVEFSVQSNQGEAMFILPLADTSLCSFVYQRPLTVHRIDDTFIRAQNKDAVVRRGQRQLYRAEVSSSSGTLDIAVSLDGKPALHWRGVPSEHSFAPHLSATPRLLGVLGLGAWNAEVHFYRAAVSMLSGELEQVDLTR